MRILVAGGGIGGMAAAVALLQEGFDPLVLEQAHALREVGAGLSLSANAMKALAHLGADELVRRTGVAAQEIVFHDLDNGQRIFATTLGDDAARRYGDGFYLVHRADLLAALTARLPPEHVRLNSRVVAIDETPYDVGVRLADGEEIRGDILIGADGLKSIVRQHLFGAEEARFTGYVGWRAVIRSGAAPDIPVRNCNASWWGPRRSAVFFPMRGGALLHFVGYVPAEEIHRESWTNSGDVAELKKSFEGACPTLLSIVQSVREAFLTAIYFRDPLQRWCTARIALLGDAAHPAQPTANQGAAMALEDAITLARCLKRQQRGDTAAALHEYAVRRQPRTMRSQLAARATERMMFEDDPQQIRARNGRFCGLQRLDATGATLWRWLHEHDPVAAADAPLPRRSTPALARPEAQRAFEHWRTMLSPEDQAAGWRGQRAGYERFWRQHNSIDPETVVESVRCNGVNGLLGKPASTAATAPIHLHLHGGGFVMGSAQASLELATRIAASTQSLSLIIDYRLAPEHPYPAALDDALAVYRWLRNQFGEDRRVVITAECAGAAIALSLVLSLRDMGKGLPAMLYLVSPFCDLSLQSRSIDASVGRDPWFNRDFLTALAASYIHRQNPCAPFLAALHSDLRGLPPLLIHAASDEALRDDACRLAELASAAGVPTRLRLFDDTVHSFVRFKFLPEAEEALRDFVDFHADILSAEAASQDRIAPNDSSNT